MAATAPTAYDLAAIERRIEDKARAVIDARAYRRTVGSFPTRNQDESMDALRRHAREVYPLGEILSDLRGLVEEVRRLRG